MDLETIGYFLYMEKQENRSKDLKTSLGREEATQDGEEQKNSDSPIIAPPGVLWTETDK